MNDNDKAAIAGRVWEPGQMCEGRNLATTPKRCHYCGTIVEGRKRGEWKPWDEYSKHEKGAPDMHDPANLWRALENVVLIERTDAEGYVCDQKLHQPELWYSEPFWNCRIDSWMETQRNPKISGAVFAALVALYDAEHPWEEESGTTKG